MQTLILEKAAGFRDLQVSVRLNDLLRTPYSSTRDIGEIIATNPLLAGKILRTVNSSYFGLLHDVGKYLLPIFGGECIRPTAGMPSSMYEEECFGVSHSLLGGVVAGEWQMPATVVGCIEYHHHPLFAEPEEIPERYRTPSFIICIADLLCKALGYGGNDPEIFPIRDGYFKEYGLNRDLQLLITPALISEVDCACQRVKALTNVG